MTAGRGGLGRAELWAVRRGPVLGAAAAAGALAVLDLTVWPNGPGSILTWLAVALTAGAMALALDDPAGDVLDATPTSRRLRTGVRIVATLPLLAGWAAYALVLQGQLDRIGGSVSAVALVVVGAGFAVLGVAGAAALRANGQREPGGVVASALVLAALAVFVLPWPGAARVLDVSGAWTSSTAGWLVATVLAAGVGWVATSDPWRRVAGARHRR